MQPQEGTPSAFAKALEKSYADEHYFVIAGSSPLRQDLEGELSRVQAVLGSQFTRLFPLAKICPPTEGNRNYALVIGEDLSFDDAKKRQALAVDMGSGKIPSCGGRRGRILHVRSGYP
jgi:hypothetical protein